MQLKQQSKIFSYIFPPHFPCDSFLLVVILVFLIIVVFVLSFVSFFVICPNGTRTQHHPLLYTSNFIFLCSNNVRIVIVHSC